MTQKPKLKIVYKKLIDLRDASYNPRKITEKQLAEIKLSMDKFGTVEPLIINTFKGRENVIVGGHRRKQVLLAEGVKEAPCVEVCLNKKEERELNIRLNKNTGSFDDELLEDFFDKSELQQWGFDDFELNGMFVDSDTKNNEDEDEGDDVENGEGSDNINKEEPPEIEEDKIGILLDKWNVKLGQVWKLGKHRLMCGDATKKEDVDKLMQGVKADMVFTDPPYGISIVGKSGKVGGDNLAKNGVYAEVAGDGDISVALKAIEIIKEMDSKVQIIRGGNYYASSLSDSPCWIVWDKREEMSGNNFADCELAWTNQESAVRKFGHLWSGMIKASEHGQKRVHPTQKPVALAEWCIEKYGSECTSVLDLFGGSGFTLLACERMHKNCYMMELSPDYIAVILERYKRETQEEPELVEGYSID